MPLFTVPEPPPPEGEVVAMTLPLGSTAMNEPAAAARDGKVRLPLRVKDPPLPVVKNWFVEEAVVEKKLAEASQKAKAKRELKKKEGK